MRPTAPVPIEIPFGHRRKPTPQNWEPILEAAKDTWRNVTDSNDSPQTLVGQARAAAEAPTESRRARTRRPAHRARLLTPGQRLARAPEILRCLVEQGVHTIEMPKQSQPPAASPGKPTNP